MPLMATKIEKAILNYKAPKICKFTVTCWKPVWTHSKECMCHLQNIAACHYKHRKCDYLTDWEWSLSVAI